VQVSLSLQGEPSALGVEAVHAPVWDTHVPGVSHSLAAVQTTRLPPVQTPAAQRSFAVQASLSSQGVSLGFGVGMQVPVFSSQATAAWH
jgi:hypothetical protein